MKSTIQLNRGVNPNGGAFFTQNIAPAIYDGVLAGLGQSIRATRTAETTAEGLTPIYGFTQTGNYYDNLLDIAIWGKGTDGNMWLFSYGGYLVSKVSTYSQTNSISRGIGIDPNGTLIYTGNKYLGRAYKTTLSAELAAAANTCDLTDASNFPTAGYAVVKNAYTTNSEVIQWTGKSSNQLTGVTRGKYYSTDRTHASGTEVFYFKDDWKDLGSTLTSSTREIMVWEDWVFIANGRYVAGYSTENGSDFVTNKLTLPPGYDIVSFGLLPTGSSSQILVCANKGNVGTIFVWDGSDTKWIRTIKTTTIFCSDNRYVGTDSGLFITDGVTLNLVWRGIETNKGIGRGNFIFYDIVDRQEFVYFSVADSSRSGLFAVDEETLDSYFIVGQSRYTNPPSSIFFSTDRLPLISSNYNQGTVNVLSAGPLANGCQYMTMFRPLNASRVELKKAKLNIAADMGTDLYPDSLKFDIVLRCYDFKRPFNRRTQLKSGTAETDKNKMVVTELVVPRVGDRVEIIDRQYVTSSDVAFCPRNITEVEAISGGYILTLDEDLPNKINATTYGNSTEVRLYPLTKVNKFSVDYETNLNELEFYFPLEVARGKKFLFEIEVRCSQTTMPIELNSLEIEYDVL